MILWRFALDDFLQDHVGVTNLAFVCMYGCEYTGSSIDQKMFALLRENKLEQEQIRLRFLFKFR